MHSRSADEGLSTLIYSAQRSRSHVSPKDTVVVSASIPTVRGSHSGLAVDSRLLVRDTRHWVSDRRRFEELLLLYLVRLFYPESTGTASRPATPRRFAEALKASTIW